MDQLVQMLGQFVANHTYLSLGILVGLWLLSNIVSAMPSPDQGSSPWYKFLFTLGHSLVGSIPRILPSLRLPSDPSRSSTPYFGGPKDTTSNAETPTKP